MTQHIQSSIGIDLGSWTSKIAVAKPGGVQVITNQANFRETPSIVGYGSGERKIGEAGNIKLKSNFNDTIISPMRFFGLSSKQPNFKTQAKYCPAKASNNNSKELLFNVNYQGQRVQLTPQQVTAAYLTQLNKTIKTNNLNPKQIVLSVPSYFTSTQRQSLIDSTKIAGIQIKNLMNQNSAIVYQYGQTKKSQLDQNKFRNVLFVDFGYSKFSCYVCSFNKNTGKFLQEINLRNIGCRNIDMEIFQFYRKIFHKQTGLDLIDNPKAIRKIMENIQRQRKILSGNKQHDLNIQYLYQDNDLQYCMQRSQFQQIAKPIFTQIGKIFNQIKTLILKKRIPIHSIELIGGGSRIPMFINLVKQVFGIQPSRTLNSSQSIAKGCALFAASKSSRFRVPKFEIIQKVNNGVIVSWNFTRKNHQFGYQSHLYSDRQRKILYSQGEYNVEKQLRIVGHESLQILLEYQSYIPGRTKILGYFITEPQRLEHTNYITVFKFKFDENGLINIVDCFLEQQPHEQNYTDYGFFGRRNTFGHYTPRSKNQTLQKLPLKIQQFLTNTITVQQLTSYKKIQQLMIKQDQQILQTYQIKNLLQSKIYDYKSKIGNQNLANQKLDQINNWIYQEGINANKKQFESKLNEIEQLMKQNIQNSKQNQQMKIETEKQETITYENPVQDRKVLAQINNQPQIIEQEYTTTVN